MYIPAPYGTPWQYCSYSRFNTPLSEITFCFHTAWADLRHLSLDKSSIPHHVKVETLQPIFMGYGRLSIFVSWVV